MRPTVEASRLGLENRHRKISGRGCNAKRCNRAKSTYSAVRSDPALNKVSRRDVRTQPGVLTPGTDQRNDPPHRGGRAAGTPGKQIPNSHGIRDFVCRPIRAVSIMDRYPGLKPRAESCYPFGINSVRFRTAGLSLIEMLVVVAIIAAIAALITTSVMSALQQQNQRVCLNNMLTIEAAKDEYIRDHPGATSIDPSAFQQYFRFGIPRCPDNQNRDYQNLYNLTQQVYCTAHPENQQKLSAAPSPQ
jgi:prepilin-type N-terminal cleavage/methylation domain-containing protein